MRMQDWVEKLDAFLKFNEYDILHHPGKVSHEVAAHLAQDEYERFVSSRITTSRAISKKKRSDSWERRNNEASI